MIAHLQRMISRLRATPGWLSPPPASPPEDPELGVREPRWRRPSAGAAAVAVAEPEEPRATIASATQRLDDMKR